MVYHMVRESLILTEVIIEGCLHTGHVRMMSSCYVYIPNSTVCVIRLIPCMVPVYGASGSHAGSSRLYVGRLWRGIRVRFELKQAVATYANSIILLKMF